MKKQFRLLNDTFIHLDNNNKGYIVHAKESKYIEWIHNGVGKQQETFDSLTEDDETFYVDKFLPLGLRDNKSSKKYGMILECGWLNQPIIDDVKNKLNQYMSCYEMIFTWSEELVNLHDRIKWIPGYGSYIKNPQIYSKDKLVSIICSMQNWLPGHQDRLAMVEQLSPYAPWFGKGRGDMEIKFKEEGLADYMFSVAIENMDNWFTEKLLDCFLTGTVPIFYGTSNIGKWFNLDGIIILKDEFDIESLTEEMYYSKMDAIKDNYERALKMEIVEDFIWENYFAE
jgi:hypothetical protein